jgi:hypothetical protein
MSVYSPAQTGPKTTEGKAASSRNATKLGVYSNSLMPGESEQELLDLNNSLRETFEVDDGMCEMQIRTISQSFLKTKRLHDAEVKLVQTCMARHENRKEFALQANMPPLSYERLPDWYFGEDPKPKEKAISRYEATREALLLKANFKLEYSQQARTLLPNLWVEVMGPNAINPSQSLGEKLLASYGQSQPQSNLQAFVDDYRVRFFFDMLWGESHERYEMVIENLRAKALIDVSVRADFVKLETQLHRRRIEAVELINQLKGMRAIEMVATLAPLKALAHSSSKEKASVKDPSSPSLAGKGKGNGKAHRVGAGG